MDAKPIEVARNEWSVILNHERWRTLEMTWLPTTRGMTDDGFKESLDLLAAAGERVRPQFMIIDSTEFLSRPSDEALAWRDRHIIPRYNAAGVTKFAMLWPEGMPGTVESGAKPAPEPGANFPTGWFSARDRLHQWLGE